MSPDRRGSGGTHFLKHFWASPLQWGTATPGGMFGQGATCPWTQACLSRGKGARTTSPSGTVGTATMSTEGTPCR